VISLNIVFVYGNIKNVENRKKYKCFRNEKSLGNESRLATNSNDILNCMLRWIVSRDGDNLNCLIILVSVGEKKYENLRKHVEPSISHLLFNLLGHKIKIRIFLEMKIIRETAKRE
jgi:hypothetical protein